MGIDLRKTNIYEVNLRQYTQEGTLTAFESELPRLKQMGVEIVWFMPITPISVLNRKGTLGSYYACADYTSINPEYGDLQDFKRVVKKAHDLKLKVIIDWVANHTGWDHVWTKSNPEFYQKNEYNQFTERNGWEDVIDLNYFNLDMQQAMVDSMKFWVEETGIDGFRCDMAMLVPLEFWRKAKNQLDQIKKLIWLGECEDLNYFEVFDMLYAWEWMHNTRRIATHKLNKYHLSELIHSCQNRTPSGKYFLYFTSNHDENSWNGTEYERYGAYARFYAVLSALMPSGVPLIYSGQELPLMHRLKFFDKDLINWNTHIPQLDFFYNSILSVRKNFEDRVEYEINKLVPVDEIFSMRVFDFDSKLDVILIMNLSSEVREFTLTVKDLSSEYKNLLTREIVHLSGDDKMRLEGCDFRIYQSF